jgi:hypothetical protein
MPNVTQLQIMNNTNYVIKNQSVARMAQYYSIEFKYVLSKVRTKWSTIIGDFLREETGLRLNSSKGRKASNSQSDRIIRYDEKLDRGEVFLKALDEKYADLDFDEFLANRNLRKEIVASEKYFLDKRESGLNEHYNQLAKYLDAYVAKYNVENIIQELYKNNERSLDIWGTYHLNDSHIELYIIPLVLYSKLFPINLEYALLTTLVHEMAHAYHHIGKDKEGKIWNQFHSADDNIVEGLAEYYTWMFVEDYKNEYPEMKTTYDYMYQCLSGPYIIFQDWIKEKYSKEHVRIALQAARRIGIKDYQEFLKSMEEANKLIK